MGSEVLRRVAAGVVIVTAVACVGFVVARRTTARPAPAVIQAAAPISEEISLRLSATPPTARVVIDGESPRAAPLDMRVKKDDREHHVRFEADGYVPRMDTVRFTSNVALSVDLQAVPVKKREGRQVEVGLRGRCGPRRQERAGSCRPGQGSGGSSGACTGGSRGSPRSGRGCEAGEAEGRDRQRRSVGERLSG